MVREQINRTVSAAEKMSIMRIIVRHTRRGGEALECELFEHLKELVARKYDAAYHSGYTVGQENPKRKVT